MKREHEESSGGPPTKGKFKMIKEETDGGVDELLAALGYKVRSSDMADVALKLEQLDMVMGSSAAAQDDAIVAQLSSDTVHYNPSDLSTWLESMLSEVDAPPPLPCSNPMTNNTSSSSQINPFDFQYYTNNESSSLIASSDLRSDLTAVTAGSCRNQKRQRTTMTSSSSSSSSSEIHPPPAPLQPPSEASSAHPLVLIDSQEAGIRLVHSLMACAEAVEQKNFTAADILVKQITILASSQGGAMRKVANYFAEALSRRIYKINPHQDLSLESSFSDILHMHFYESCPYLKFAHFTANQAILEAFEGCKRVHVIDFGMKQGMQWPALLQALAVRPGGPPSFRLTGIGPPQPDNTDALQQVGWKLAQLADSVRVDFEYRGFVASSLSDLEAYMFKSDPTNEIEPETVAVNSVFELHKLLSRQRAIEKVLNTVKGIKPKIVTVVEQEADHNSDSFSVRFTEALHYYSTMFDSLEGGCGSDGAQDRVMSEVYLGKEICNVVACEGQERVERHEKLEQWRRRLGRAGFESVHLGSNAFKQASMLLSLFAGGDGYKVEEKEGCLTLGWHSRPLIATSAWRVAGDG